MLTQPNIPVSFPLTIDLERVSVSFAELSSFLLLLFCSSSSTPTASSEGLDGFEEWFPVEERPPRSLYKSERSLVTKSVRTSYLMKPECAEVMAVRILSVHSFNSCADPQRNRIRAKHTIYARRRHVVTNDRVKCGSETKKD